MRADAIEIKSRQKNGREFEHTARERNDRSGAGRMGSRGFAVDDEEMEIGTRCIGAAVPGSEGQVVAAVSVFGSTTRIATQRAPMIANHVSRCCQAISLSLGAATRGCTI